MLSTLPPRHFLCQFGEVIFGEFHGYERLLSILGFLCLFTGILITSSESENKKTKLYCKIQIIIGLLPFIIVLISSINSSIIGEYSRVLPHPWINGEIDLVPVCGLESFILKSWDLSLEMWPFYIIGLALTIKGIKKIRRINKNN